MSEDALRERLRGERDERRRIGELVHDGPVQHVAALTQMLDAAVVASDTDPAAARAITVRALEVARDAVAELREIAAGLEPIALHEDGLAAAVGELGARVAHRHGVDLELRLQGHEDLGEGARSGLYQIVREGLDQAIRRGPPATVRITLTPTPPGGVVLEVTDDAAPERRQAVLDGLAERAADLNATFSASRQGSTTIVTVTLPPSATTL